MGSCAGRCPPPSRVERSPGVAAAGEASRAMWINGNGRPLSSPAASGRSRVEIRRVRRSDRLRVLFIHVERRSEAVDGRVSNVRRCRGRAACSTNSIDVKPDHAHEAAWIVPILGGTQVTAGRYSCADFRAEMRRPPRPGNRGWRAMEVPDPVKGVTLVTSTTRAAGVLSKGVGVPPRLVGELRDRRDVPSGRPGSGTNASE